MIIEFTVYGIPQPAGSKSGFPFKKRDGSLGVRMTDSNKKSKPWQALVQTAAMEAYDGPLLKGPLEVEMWFYFDRNAGHYGTGRNAGILKASAPEHRIVRPDALKLSRGTEDACTGIIWKDDAQTVDLLLHKRFCNEGERPRAEITIRSL